MSNSTDCNDSNGNIRPGGSEVCDGLDTTATAPTDEGVTSPTTATRTVTVMERARRPGLLG
ncbi:putative metal-binding motif-containing protein, partial [Pyxidicoccus sp. 3LG]